MASGRGTRGGTNVLLFRLLCFGAPLRRVIFHPQVPPVGIPGQNIDGVDIARRYRRRRDKLRAGIQNMSIEMKKSDFGKSLTAITSMRPVKRVKRGNIVSHSALSG